MSNARRCHCDRCVIGGPWTVDQCSLCWHWHNTPHVREHWETGGMPAVVPCGDIVAAVARFLGADRVAKLWERWTGKPCGCADRRKRLNEACGRLERWLGRLRIFGGGKR